jgi:hypothetical protein
MFNSRISLCFKDKFYESKYDQEMSISRKKYNLILSLIMTCISISISILMLLEYSSLQVQFNTYYSALFCFVTTLLTIFLTLLCLFLNGKKSQEWLSHLNYMLILFVFADARYYFVWVLKIDLLVYALIFVFEVIFRLMWSVLGLVDFVPGVYLQVTSIVLNFLLFFPLLPVHFYFRFSIYTCILILNSIMSYFYIIEQKRCFYYNLSLKLKNEWYESIIDNMNSGFISIKDKEIQYYNKTLLSFLIKRSDSNNSENINLINNVDINELFDDIIFENCKINAFEQVTSILNKKYNEVGDKFVFLGTKDIDMTTTSCINLEVYGRSYSSFIIKLTDMNLYLMILPGLSK